MDKYFCFANSCLIFRRPSHRFFSLVIADKIYDLELRIRNNLQLNCMLQWNYSVKSRAIRIPKNGRVTKILTYIIAETPIEFNAFTESEKELVFLNGKRSVVYSHSRGTSAQRVFDITLDKGILPFVTE